MPDHGNRPDSADPAQRAMQNARTMRGRRSGDPDYGRRRRNRVANLRGRSAGYSGPGPDGLDPQPLGAVLNQYIDDQGWEAPLAAARVFAEWPQLVGDDIAKHCAPVTLHDGELRISAESTAWATQLRLLVGCGAGPAGGRARPGDGPQADHQRADRAELEARPVQRPRRPRAAGHLRLTAGGHGSSGLAQAEIG